MSDDNASIPQRNELLEPPDIERETRFSNFVIIEDPRAKHFTQRRFEIKNHSGKVIGWVRWSSVLKSFVFVSCEKEVWSWGAIADVALFMKLVAGRFSWFQFCEKKAGNETNLDNVQRVYVDSDTPGSKD